jgi:7-cyano-7-deazaguanine reductase
MIGTLPLGEPVDMSIVIEAPLTSICPVTGEPDQSVVRIEYAPNLRLIEVESLRRYLATYADRALYHETIADAILGDLVEAVAPKRMSVTDTADIGGLRLTVAVSHDATER